MNFVSPKEGMLTVEDTFEKIMEFVRSEHSHDYRLIVGTDSQPGFDEAVFVTAIVIYRVGRGGRYFYHKSSIEFKAGMKQRIFYEVSRSLKVAGELTSLLALEEIAEENVDIEVHIDVGENGPTNQIIKEVVGMVVGSGFEAYIKPDAYAASTVADKFTK